MPARLDIDRDQVKMLALSVGAREAARRLGMKETTVKQWATRGKWFVQSPKPALPPTMSQPVAIVAKPAEILADVLADDSRETRIQLSQYARKTSAHAAKLKGDKALQASRAVKDVAAVADTVHGWSDKTNIGLQVNILSLGGSQETGI